MRRSRAWKRAAFALQAWPILASTSATKRVIPTPDGGMETRFVIGITIGPELTGGEYVDEVIANPFVALWRGVVGTADMFVLILRGLGQLLSGSVGIGGLAGPIVGKIDRNSGCRRPSFTSACPS